MNNKKIVEAKIRKMVKRILSENEESAQGTAKILLLFDKLSKIPQFQSAVSELKMPLDKFNAIVKFANMLGVPEQKFIDFTNNMNNLKNKQNEQ